VGVPAEPLQRSMERLKSHLAELGANGVQPVILCDNPGQRDRLFELLGDTGATLGVGLVSAGFTLKAAALAVLTDHEIFVPPAATPEDRRPRWRSFRRSPATSWSTRTTAARTAE
jgi:hypothetical protein